VSDPAIHIQKASEKDVPLILEFIRKLAEYERRLHEMIATEDGLHAALFGNRPVAEVLLAYMGDEPAGFALYFPTFSTFLGRAGIHLEDVFVDPQHRRKGIGRMLMVEVAKVACEYGGRLEWWVLRWNQPALDFYKGMGSQEMDEWAIYRLNGAALEKLAHS
jgi:GNAT superfamily N-acetyltransferase